MPQKEWLRHYSSVFTTVELNVTFYRLPPASSFDRWYQETPDDFVFSVKGSRFITHVKKLLDPEEPVKLFFRGALRLKEKLGVVLWQFPPSFKKNEGRLRDFLRLLAAYPARSALEFRNESWITGEVADLCMERRAALCMADWPSFNDDLPVTSDFVYTRRHGASGSYDTCYSEAELRRDAGRIRGYLRKKKDVYIYFNNDAGGYAPANARELRGLLRR